MQSDHMMQQNDDPYLHEIGADGMPKADVRAHAQLPNSSAPPRTPTGTAAATLRRRVSRACGRMR